MPGSSNTSFIPKRNPGQNDRRSVRRQVYVGTFIVRILFFAALLAAVGVYAYESKLQNDMNEEVASLNNAIKSFNEAEMQRVISTDVRLRQATYRKEHSVSISSVLGAIEKSTIKRAQITGLNVKRVDDASLQLAAEMKVDNFDSALFQKDVFENDEILAIEGIKDLTLNRNIDEKAGGAETVTIAFQAVIGIDADDVPHSISLDNVMAPVVSDISTTSEEAEAEEGEVAPSTPVEDGGEVSANDETI